MRTSPDAEIATPASATAEGTVTIALSPADSLALLVARDPDQRVVASGVGRIRVAGLPGIYTVEILVPGKQEERPFLIAPGTESQITLEAPQAESVIPTDHNPLWEMWAKKEVLGAIAEPAQGRIAILTWAEEPHAEPDYSVFDDKGRSVLRIASAAPTPPPSAISLESFDLEPGTLEVEFVVPVEGRRQKRRQPVFVEKGWVTLLFVRRTNRGTDFSTATLCVFPAGKGNVKQVRNECRKTELALEALYFGQEGITEEEAKLLEDGGVTEPIRAMASAYARLLPFLRWFDARAGGDATARRHLPRHPLETLDAVYQLGAQTVTLLPNSVDARLIAVAALWFQAALRALQSDDILSPIRRLFQSRFRWPHRARQLRRLATLLFVALLLVFFGSVSYFNASRESAHITQEAAAAKSSGDDRRVLRLERELQVEERKKVFSAVGMGLGVVLFLGSGCWLLWDRRRNAFLFDAPPLFAVGTEILLRLAALQEQVCHPDSRITDVALRLTTDSLWTRWNSEISAEQARQQFSETIKELQTNLAPSPEADTALAQSERDRLRRSASKNLAFSLRLPLSFVSGHLRQSSKQLLEWLIRTPGKELRLIFALRMTPSKAASQLWWQRRWQVIMGVAALDLILLLTPLILDPRSKGSATPDPNVRITPSPEVTSSPVPTPKPTGKPSPTPSTRGTATPWPLPTPTTINDTPGGNGTPEAPMTPTPQPTPTPTIGITPSPIPKPTPDSRLTIKSRDLATALRMYTQDYDETFPSVERAGQWKSCIAPYIKFGGSASRPLGEWGFNQALSGKTQGGDAASAEMVLAFDEQHLKDWSIPEEGAVDVIMGDLSTKKMPLTEFREKHAPKILPSPYVPPKDRTSVARLGVTTMPRPAEVRIDSVVSPDGFYEARRATRDQNTVEVRVVVRAEGYEAFTATVKLTYGKYTNLPVSLRKILDDDTLFKPLNPEDH